MNKRGELVLTGRSPEHWNAHSGPANWYTVAYPPSWTIEEADGAAGFLPAEGQAALTLYCLWSPEWPDADLNAAAPIEQLFPQHRRVRAVDSLDVPYESIALEGEAVFDEPPPLWKKLFTKPGWRRWRIWVVRHQNLCLIATYLQIGDHDPEVETMTRMILNTLELADHPADPPEVFAQRVLELARSKFPLLEAEQGEDFQLRLGESQVNLFNFYRSYVNAPERFEEIILPALTTVVQVQEWGGDQTEPPLDSVRDRIMPMLYPSSVWRENFPNFVGMPWVADLMVLYVVDESHAYWYIRDDLLGAWSLTSEELHELALQNLDAYFEKNTMEFTLAGEDSGPLVLMPNRPDAYNTSRILSASFHERLRELLGREFAVGIPNRDFFVAVNLSSPETIEHVRAKVLEDYAQMDHPLSDRLLLVSTDGVSEYPIMDEDDSQPQQ
jgi:hypothetical protein